MSNTDPLVHEEAPKVEVKSVVVVKPLPPDVTYMGGPPVPPRQVWVAGLTFIIAWLILYFVKRWGGPDFEAIGIAAGFPPGTVLTALAGIIGTAVASVVPPSWSDIIKRLNDGIVHAAMRDQQSNVSNEQPQVQPTGGEPAIIPGSPLNDIKAAAKP